MNTMPVISFPRNSQLSDDKVQFGLINCMCYAMLIECMFNKLLSLECCFVINQYLYPFVCSK